MYSVATISYPSAVAPVPTYVGNTPKFAANNLSCTYPASLTFASGGLSCVRISKLRNLGPRLAVRVVL